MGAEVVDVTEDLTQSAEFAALRAENAQLRQELEAAKERIATLEDTVLAFESSISQQQDLSAKLEATLAAANIGIWCLDVQANTLDWDDRMLALRGLTRDEFDGSQDAFISTVHPDDRERMLAFRAEAIRSRDPFSINFRVVHQKDGAVRHVHTSGKFVLDEAGEPIRAFGASFDITDLVEQRKELEKTQFVLKLAMNTAGLAPWSVNLTTGEITWSDEFYRLFGYEQGSLSSSLERGFDVIHPDDRALAQAAFEATSQQGSVYDIKKRLLRQDGSSRWVLSRAAIVEDQVSAERTLHGFFLDIHEHYQADAERNHLFYKSIDLQCITGYDGVFRQISDSWSKTLGWSEEELTSRPFLSFVHEEDKESTREVFRKMMEEDYTVRHFENRYHCKDGSLCWLSWTSGKYSEAEIIIATARDVTEEKAIKAQLEHTVDQLRLTNATLENFAYAASHDLKEPLNTIKGMTYLLEKKYGDALDESGHMVMNHLTMAADRMKDLVRALLDYSIISQSSARDSHCSLDDLFRDLQVDLGCLIEQSGASIHKHWDAGVTFVGDSALISDLLSNLIINAIKYKSEAPPEIHITALRQEDHWLFSIKDNGIGIKADKHERIFELFRQLHPRGKFEGLGMGLALCKRIVQFHEGRIWVESAPEKEGATRFFFTLPHVPRPS